MCECVKCEQTLMGLARAQLSLGPGPGIGRAGGAPEPVGAGLRCRQEEGPAAGCSTRRPATLPEPAAGAKQLGGVDGGQEWRSE